MKRPSGPRVPITGPGSEGGWTGFVYELKWLAWDFTQWIERTIRWRP